MKKNQYYPFNDFKPPKFWFDPEGEEPHWQEVAKRMRQLPYEEDSKMLSYLVDIYRSELKHNNQKEALDMFWKEVENTRYFGLTDDMKKVLLDAKAGNIKAAQIMVRANPVTIHLPFVAQAMRYVVSQHKYCDSKGANILKDIEYSWKDFLPKRTGGNITYNHSDLKRLILLAEKQMCEETKINVRGKKVQKTFSDAREAVAEALNISDEYLKRNIKIKTKRGREKK
ncbi:hypothetical protein C6A37_01410 [Desulfobacteraceae bacterium SEEP-SAG9]|nr:hypothetical protein C6A37_01410 [Desulfobacteraceae bacterium SEEP-SAG9]